jgi:3-oxoacyl-[acyl-carrier-protein] synthase-1
LTETIVIVSTAMAASNGLDTATVTASARAGIIRSSAFADGQLDYTPLTTAVVPDGCLPPPACDPGQEDVRDGRGLRLTRLAGLIAREFQGGVPREPVPFFAGLPRNPVAPETLARNIARQAGVTLAPGWPRPLPQGRAAGLAAVHEACRLLLSGQADKAVAGGFDTHNDPDVLGVLNRELRIRTGMSPDPFVPGEGACLLVLCRESSAERDGLPCLCRVRSSSLGVEPGHRHSDLPCLGSGLSAAFEDLFREVPENAAAVRHVFSSMNGESFWAKEWAAAFLRLRHRFHPEMALHHPAQCYGDPGAASGPLMIGLALTGLVKGYLEGPVLVYASSDHEERAAVLLESIPAEPRPPQP